MKYDSFFYEEKMHADKITQDRPQNLLNRWKDAWKTAAAEVTKQVQTHAQKTSNGWTEDNEKFLQRISEEVQANIWMCENSMGFYAMASKITNWFIFILSTVCTVITSIWAVYNNPDECEKNNTGWAVIFVITANGLIAVMSTGIELSGWNTKAQEFDEPLKDWRRLNWLVGYKISSKRKNRGNADDLLKELLDSVFAIQSATPEAPSHIKSKHKKIFANSGLFRDDSGKFSIAKEDSPAKRLPDHPPLQQRHESLETLTKTPKYTYQQQFPRDDEPSSSDDDEHDHQTNNVNLEYQLRRLDDMNNMIQQLYIPSNDDENDVVINCGGDGDDGDD